MGAIIVIALYILFLGDVWTDSLDIEGSRYLMDSWIMSGVLAITSITATMGAFGTFVDDRAKGIIRDFDASPVKKYEMAGGYILSTFIIGIIMSLVALIFAEAYIVASGGEFLSAVNMLKVLGIMLLSVISSSALVFFIVSFFHTTQSFATASTILGTLIGFITGVFIPIGALPSVIQWVVMIFPVSHSALLFRQVFMEAPMSASFAGAPSNVIADFNHEMGVTFTYGNFTPGFEFSIVVLIITAALFYILAILNLSRKNKV